MTIPSRSSRKLSVRGIRSWVTSKAKQYLDTALDYYRRNDMRPYLARVLRSLVYWYEQQSRGAEAEHARAEAQRLMEELPLPPIRLLSNLTPDPEHT